MKTIILVFALALTMTFAGHAANVKQAANNKTEYTSNVSANMAKTPKAKKAKSKKHHSKKHSTKSTAKKTK